MRAPFQVIVFPYHFESGELQVLIGRRKDNHYWQAISGGGENDESAIAAAQRELQEEASLTGINWLKLDSLCTLPKVHYVGHEAWLENEFVIPEHAFMVEVTGRVVCSEEHSELRWCSIKDAESLLKYDSNKNALWEVVQRTRTQ